MGSVTVHNCVKLYTTADEISAETLRDHCSLLISTHWVCEICLFLSLKLSINLLNLF